MCTLGPPRPPGSSRLELAVSELAVSEEDCCDVLSARTDGSLWHGLVARRAWSDERYAAWLGRLWIAVLVNPADKPAVHRKHDAGRCTGAQPTRAPGPAEQSSARTQLRVLPPGLPLSRVVLAEPLAVGADLTGTGLRFAVADGRPRGWREECLLPYPGPPPRMGRTDPCSARGGAAEKRRPPRVRLRAREPGPPRAATPRKASVGGLRRRPSDADAEAHHHDM